MRVLWLVLFTGCNLATVQDVSQQDELQPDALSQTRNSAQSKKSLSIDEPQGPVETFLFCHNVNVDPPRAIPLRYTQIGEKFTPVLNSHLYYISDKAERKFDTRGCHRSSYHIVPAEHEWKEGIIKGTSTEIKFLPSVYGYINAPKTFEQGVTYYSPNQETHLKCHAIIEIMSTWPIVLSPAKTEEQIIPYNHKDGKTYVMSSPARIVLDTESESEGGECEREKFDYRFEKRGSHGNVLEYFQTISKAIP